MTRMLPILISCGLMLLPSCSFISYSQVIPLVKTATLGVADITISEDFISEMKYSFAKVNLGKSGVAIMVLSDVDNGIYEWVSSSGEKLTTYNGKIVKASGTSFDFEVYDFRKFELLGSNTLEILLDFDVMLKSPHAFISQLSSISSKILIEDDRFNGVDEYFEEVVNTANFKWRYKNYYWKSSGRVTKSQQTVHPMHPDVTITYYYK